MDTPEAVNQANQNLEFQSVERGEAPPSTDQQIVTAVYLSVLARAEQAERELDELKAENNALAYDKAELQDDLEQARRETRVALVGAELRLRRAEQAERERDAEIEAGKFRLAALQDSIDGCAQKVLQLKARAEQAEATLQAVRDGLRTYGRHVDRCAVYVLDFNGRRPSGKPCDCGLSTLLAERAVQKHAEHT